MDEGGKKYFNYKILVGILVFLILIVVVAVIWLMTRKESYPEYEWGDIVGKCLYGNDETAINCQEFQNELENVAKNSNDESSRVNAIINLAVLYENNDNIDGAIQIVKNGLNEENSDQNKYYLLSTLASLYQSSGDENNYIEVLQKIVDLPDSMELEGEYWLGIKETYKSELSDLLIGRENDEAE